MQDLKEPEQKRAKRYLQEIPLKDLGSKAKKPGHFQADTVAHCGTSLSGTFVWTLTMTDEATGWTENRACFGKHHRSIIPAFDSIIRKLPYKPYSINTDNGTEFMNENLHEYLSEERNIKLTRSRAYRKNDNAYAEQKNFTHVREVFGYRRYDKQELVFVMNNIYMNYFNLLANFFIPQAKAI